MMTEEQGTEKIQRIVNLYNNAITLLCNDHMSQEQRTELRLLIAPIAKDVSAFREYLNYSNERYIN